VWLAVGRKAILDNLRQNSLRLPSLRTGLEITWILLFPISYYPPYTGKQKHTLAPYIDSIKKQLAMAKPKASPPHGRRPPRPGGRLAGMKRKKHPSIKNQIRSLQRRLQKQGAGGEGRGASDGERRVRM